MIIFRKIILGASLANLSETHIFLGGFLNPNHQINEVKRGEAMYVYKNVYNNTSIKIFKLNKNMLVKILKYMNGIQ